MNRSEAEKELREWNQIQCLLIKAEEHARGYDRKIVLRQLANAGKAIGILRRALDYKQQQSH